MNLYALEMSRMLDALLLLPEKPRRVYEPGEPRELGERGPEVVIERANGSNFDGV